MKTYKTKTTDVLPFDVILFSEEKGDSLYSYLLNMAEDGNISNAVKKFNRLNALPSSVIATDRYITLKEV